MDSAAVWEDWVCHLVQEELHETPQALPQKGVKGVATRKKYVFQQDGATPHTRVAVREFLQQKFGERVTSRLTPTIWFWGIADQEVRRVQPGTLNALKQVVEDMAEVMDPEQINRAAESVHDRSRVCLKKRGGPFEYCYKKEKKDF